MANQTYYDVLKVLPSATVAEIEAAYTEQYNQWRRLVIHHDPQVVAQANEALRALEQILVTLTDAGRRAAYDAGIGLGGTVGGLTDPEALLQQTGRRAGGGPPAVGKEPEPGERLDAWVCPQCGKANPTGTHYCVQCGCELGRTCPKCQTINQATSAFCQKCGVNIEEATRALEWERQRIAAQQKEQAEIQLRLQPVREAAEQAWSKARTGCTVGFFLSAVGIPWWIVAMRKARTVLQAPQVSGDAEYRSLAQKALTWSALGTLLVTLYFLALGFSACQNWIRYR